VTYFKVGAAPLVLVAALAVVVGAAARSPTPSQRAAILHAFRSVQGDVAIQKILISRSNPSFASLNWGFAHGALSARNNSVLGLAGGTWKVLWTRESEQPADGACVYVPAPVAHDLLHVTCPPPSKLHARRETAGQLAALKVGFLRSRLTPYSRTATGLTNACVSTVDPHWAAAVASFPSAASTIVWFELGKRWRPAFESVMQVGSPPPAGVVLSLASCVGYNPAEYGG
jgi:hypothetical protein